jgi:hypothetical protein
MRTLVFEFEFHNHHRHSFRKESRQHAARGNAICAIGHGVGHFDDVYESAAFHRTATLIVDLLGCNGFEFIEPKDKDVMSACVGGDLGCSLSACPLRTQAQLCT